MLEPGHTDWRPHLLFWESTTRCNLSCIHCRRTAGGLEASADELTSEEFQAVLDSAADLGRPIVVFSGGEPLLRDDWQALAEYARRLGLPTALATNGTLIDGGTAGRIAAAGFGRVAVSIDGADAATHDAFRRLGGAFERAMAGVRHLRSAGVAVQINATITRHNVDQLQALADLARGLGAEALHPFILVPVGCGAEIAETQQLTADQYRGVLEWVFRQRGRDDLEIRATCAPQYHRLAAAEDPHPGDGRGCLCGLSVIFVGHRGEVYPCGYLPVACGSVREQPLAEIWRSSPVLARLRDFGQLRGACGACRFREVCGGCRARAYAATGDYLAADPSCPYGPATRTC